MTRLSNDDSSNVAFLLWFYNSLSTIYKIWVFIPIRIYSHPSMESSISGVTFLHWSDSILSLRDVHIILCVLKKWILLHLISGFRLWSTVQGGDFNFWALIMLSSCYRRNHISHPETWQQWSPWQFRDLNFRQSKAKQFGGLFVENFLFHNFKEARCRLFSEFVKSKAKHVGGELNANSQPKVSVPNACLLFSGK